MGKGACAAGPEAALGGTHTQDCRGLTAPLQATWRAADGAAAAYQGSKLQ